MELVDYMEKVSAFWYRGENLESVINIAFVKQCRLGGFKKSLLKPNKNTEQRISHGGSSWHFLNLLVHGVAEAELNAFSGKIHPFQQDRFRKRWVVQEVQYRVLAQMAKVFIKWKMGEWFRYVKRVD